MPLKITYPTTRSARVDDALGCLSDEAFTLEELSVLQEHAWSHTDIQNPRAELFKRLEDIFAALGNDTDAIVLHVKEAGT